jgi:hypothetical protein
LAFDGDDLEDHLMTEVAGVPRFYGIYRGTVFDAVDPERKGRLRIIVPAVGGTHDPLDWAMPCWPPGWTHGLVKPHANHVFTDDADTPSSKTLVHSNNVLPAGTDPGGHVLHFKTPKRREPVWVMFEAGDARRPVWMGTWT